MRNALPANGRNFCQNQPDPLERPSLARSATENGCALGGWGTQTLVSGLTHDAVIAPWVIKGAMNGPAFAAYVREVPVPEIEPGAMVILDNLAIH
jgi:hypothetical protein